MPEDLDLLLALDVFLRERHITRAAKRLGITQSAASQRLGRLREYFGDALLAPGRPLLALTPRAQAIAGPLSAAITSLRDAIQSGAPFDAATSDRRFVVLGNDLVEAAGVPVMLPLLAREAPGVTLRVERADAQFGSRLENGTADLAFVPEFLAVPSLIQLRLPDERFVTLLRKGHPALGRKLTLERYLELDHAVIAPHGFPGSLVDQALEALGLRRRVRLWVQHFAAIPFILAASDLAVTCPSSVLRLALGTGLQALPAPLDLGLDKTSIVWHPRVDADAGHRWLRQLIIRAARVPEAAKRR